MILNSYIETYADHGLAVRTVGIRVQDASEAYEQCIAGGAKGVVAPVVTVDETTGKTVTISETSFLGDVVIRWISGDNADDGDEMSYLPSYQRLPVSAKSSSCGTNSSNSNASRTIGITRLDHVVSNVPNLLEAVDQIMRSTGWHEYAEFTAADIGTLDSGLNNMVLSNNNEFILMPVNEPTFGTKRKSQIQSYLELNNGPGIQHFALKTDDIFATVREMKNRAWQGGGFELIPPASSSYYDRIVDRIGADTFTAQQLNDIRELGLLVDKDDQGILLQIFTKPLGDRSTVFIEIIQRFVCVCTSCYYCYFVICVFSSLSEKLSVN